MVEHYPSQYVKFFNKLVCNTIVDKISTESQETKRINNRDVPIIDLVAAKFKRIGQPIDAEIAAACNGTTQLRQILNELEPLTTPWVHLCTCHAPHFLQTWVYCTPSFAMGLKGDGVT